MLITRKHWWIAGVGFVGLAAGAVAAALCWLLLTQPVAFAQYVQRAL